MKTKFTINIRFILVSFSLMVISCSIPTQPSNTTTYSVIYNANGSISGTAPSDSTKYHSGDTVHVAGNTNLAETWYSFAGWNTKTDQSGTYYAAGSTFIMGSSDVTLYAMWGGTTSTLAGSGTSGSANGTGTEASFNIPEGLAADSNGNIYVADSGNNLIRKITPAGVVTTFAGSGATGSTNGPALTASFNGPDGIAIDSGGNLYVTDCMNNLIRKITPTGTVSTLAGSGAKGSTNGAGIAASFYLPSGIIVDPAGTVYVADSGNNIIRAITPGGVVSTFAGTGTQGFQNGSRTTASFDDPGGIAEDSLGNLYISDYENEVIRKITSGGTVSTFAGGGGGSSDQGAGFINGKGTAAAFWGPCFIAIDSSGNLYVTDLMNQQVRKITPDGVVTSLAGAWPIIDGFYSPVEGESNGVGPAATFSDPTGVAVDSSGNVYVADYFFIRKIQ